MLKPLPLLCARYLIVMLIMAVVEVGAGTISGTVTDHTGTIPLENIVAEAYKNESGWQYKTSQLTDNNGNFSIDVTSFGAGQYVMRFFDSNGNYLEQFYNGASSFFTASNLTLTINNAVTNINAQLDETSQISGKVLGPDESTPLASIYVTVYLFRDSSWEEVGSSSTDENGDYQIAGLIPGDYRIRFLDFNGEYLTEWYDDATSFNSALDFQVPLSTNVANMDAILTVASKISGTVIDSTDSTPLEGIAVSGYVWNGDFWEYINVTYTDASGNYTLAGLAAGTYRVEFLDGNGVYVTIYYDQAAELATALNILVSDEETVTAIDAAMYTSSSISGIVTGPDESPLGSIEISAYFWNGADWILANIGYSNGSGYYEIAGLSPGTYRVGFDGGFNYGFPMWYYDQILLDFNAATDIIVGGGVVVTGIHARLSMPPNEAPSDITLTASVVNENSPAGTFIGTLSTEDEDDGDTFTYEMVSGEGSEDNSLFSIDTNTLQTAEVLNYENQSNRTIRIRSSDQGGLYHEKIFLITVVDIDEVPVMMGIERSVPNGIVIQWSSISNQPFAVYSSTNLQQGFSVVIEGIQATPPLNIYTLSLDNVNFMAWQIVTDD